MFKEEGATALIAAMVTPAARCLLKLSRDLGSSQNLTTLPLSVCFDDFFADHCEALPV